MSEHETPLGDHLLDAEPAQKPPKGSVTYVVIDNPTPTGEDVPRGYRTQINMRQRGRVIE